MTLSISDINQESALTGGAETAEKPGKQRSALWKVALGYFLAALVLALGGIVYTALGYGQSSDFMTFAFVPSLVGAVIFGLMALLKLEKRISLRFLYLWHYGTAFLTVRMLLNGVFSIAGVRVPEYLPAFSAVAGILFVLCIVLTLVRSSGKKGERFENSGIDSGV